MATHTTLSPPRAIFRMAQDTTLVTAYPVQRPDGSWALLIINKDQDHPHTVRVRFQNSETGVSNAFKGEVAELFLGVLNIGGSHLRRSRIRMDRLSAQT